MQQGEPEILYEDNHLIAVNKPHGWLVHGDKTSDFTVGDWLKNYIKQKYNKPGDVFLGTVHRLDRPVGGVMIFARTSKSLERMNKMFASKLVKKKYQAIIDKIPQPEEQTLIHWLRKNPDTNKVDVSNIEKSKEYKLSETKYKLAGAYKKYFLVDLEPVTGRSHQLRAQMSYVGYPIIGDLKYGSNKKCDDGNIALKCISLCFEHPVKKELLNIMLPEIVWNV